MNFFIILLLSFCINLFSLCIYKYLNFFVIPESVFLCLLLTGIPLGAALGIKFIKKGITVARSVSVLIIVCVFSYAGIFALSRLHVLLSGGNAYDDILIKYLIVFIAELICFIPFFMAYGFCEFMCYSRTDVSVIKIYAGFLTGCALAFICIRFLVYPAGVFRLSLLSVAGLCVIFYILLNRKTITAKVTTAIIFLAATVPLFLSGFEADMQHLIFGKPGERKVLAEQWNDYCYFSVIRGQGGLYDGFYNNIFAWHFGDTVHMSKDMLPYRLIGSNKDIAVLGSGGGLQIKQSLPFHPRSLDAVEIVPAVIHLLKGVYAREFDNVYNLPFVNTYIMDGRKFLEKSNRKYDLIYMASTDGPLGLGKTLLQMHHSLSTKEAFDTIYNRLNEGGILAIRQGNFFRYYFTSLQHAGFRVFAYKSRESGDDSTENPYWLIAVKASDQTVYSGYLKKLPPEDMLFEKIGYERIENVENYPFQTITDDKPLKGGILLDVMPENFVRNLFGGLFLITVLLTAALTAVLRYSRRNKDSAEKKMFRKTGFAALMTGMNFIVLENYLIYHLNRYLDVPLDAVFIGMIVFVICAAIGAGLLNDKLNRFVLYLCLVIVFMVFVFQGSLSTPLILTLMIMPFIFTGTFFPSLLRGDDDKKLAVYIFDGIGAFIGAVISFSLPLLTGFRMFYIAALVIFVLTAISVTSYRTFWHNYTGGRPV